MLNRRGGSVAWSPENLYKAPNKDDFVVVFAPLRSEIGEDGELFGRCREEHQKDLS